MALTVRVSPGDWGGAPPDNIGAVVLSAAESLAALDEDESLAILVEPTVSPDDSPIALVGLSVDGEFIVRLPVRDTLWARFAFQSAHEICHVLADTRTFTWDRFTWIEEVLCETASLFALRRMAETWRSSPPYPNWSEYAPSLAEYEASRIAEPGHSLPPGETFENWLPAVMPLLEADSGRRADNTVIAKELLPLFEVTEGAWRAIRSLHTAPRTALSPAAFLWDWAAATPERDRVVIDEIRLMLGPGATP